MIKLFCLNSKKTIERAVIKTKIFYQTFGCKVNSFETSAVIKLLTEHGFETTENKEGADIVFINSCTVTETGDSKVKKFMRSVKSQNPSTIVILSGCFPQADPTLASEIKEADIICGNKNRKDLPHLLNKFLQQKNRIVEIPIHSKGDIFEAIDSPIHVKHTRAFIKIQDGCDRFCAYCIVPYARGSVRSLSLEEITSQTQKLSNGGYKEVVVSGINLSRYGADTGFTLADAIETISKVDGISRIRLGSLEPDLLTDDILSRLSKIKKICPSFHLSLQSGSNETLKRMKRRYKTSEFVAVKQKLEKLFFNPTFTTDVIVGFPGETDQEFNESLNFTLSQNFLKVHVFPYSKRKGTAAAEFDAQISEDIKKKRAKVMGERCETVRNEIIKSYDGKTVEVLTERKSADGSFSGYSTQYLPVKVCSETVSSNQIIVGTVTAFDDDVVKLRID